MHPLRRIGVLSDLSIQYSMCDSCWLRIFPLTFLQVKASGKSGKMRNFKDPGLKNGIFVLELISAIEPRAVDWDVVIR